MKNAMVAACAAVLLAAAGAVAAQTFPNRIVRIHSPYPTGAGPDLTARLFAERLSRLWSQQVVVEARPGASGFIAIEAGRKGAADGHDLIVVGDAHLTTNPHLVKGTPYDPERDFTPIALQYRTPFFFVVSAAGPYKSFQDVIGAAKAAPGRISVAVPYHGSPAHLGGIVLERVTGTRMEHIAFKENAPLYAALVNGDIHWTFATVASAGPFYRSGRARFLAVASATRLPAYADIPTLAEVGGPAGLEVKAWVAFIGPRGIPADVVAKIHRDVAQVQADPEFRARLDTFGFIPETIPPAALATLITDDLKRNGDLIRSAGLKLE